MWEEEEDEPFDAMPSTSPTKKKNNKAGGSQFAGAAAMFRQKDSDVMKKQSTSVRSPRKDSQFAGTSAMFGQDHQRANASMSDLSYTPPSSKLPTKKQTAGTNLDPPPFVSPGANHRSGGVGGWKSKKSTPSGSQFPTSSYLDKPSGLTTTPKSSKPKFGGSYSGGLNYTPEKSKPTWREKQQQKNGGLYSQNYLKSPVGGGGSSSFLTSPTPMKKPSALSPAADIKIEVKIPDIEKKMRARKASAARPPPKRNDDDNVPEHVRKFRELERARKAALDQKEYDAAVMVQKYFLGWKARVEYPKIKKSNEERLRKLREAEKLRQLKISSAIMIQKVFRGYMPREEFHRRLTIKRRRDKNKKEIKRIKGLIKNMPKKTKTDIKDMKKEYSDRKKTMKKEMKKQLKDEEKKLDDIKKQGKDQIEYLKQENDKVREQQKAIKQETQILEKQFEVLMAKAEETRRNFSSLQQFVNKKNQSIQKNEIASQKCRHHYLPKYRSEMAGRNKHCIAEYRIKTLYKKKLHHIVKEILEHSSDPDIVEDAHEALLQCESDLKCMPQVPIPEGLRSWINPGE